MKRILIIQTAFIGDVVLATALVEKLHLHYPDASIDMLVRKGNEGLLLDHPFLNACLVWDKKQQKYPNLFRMLRKIRQAKYDLVVNLQRFAATGLLTALSGATQTIGFDKNPWSPFFSKRFKHRISDALHPLHEVDRNQELIAALTDKHPAMPRLYPNSAAFEKVASYKTQPYIVVAPASVWFTKQWPAQKWIDLIQQVPASFSIYLLGALSDNALCKTIKEGSGRTNLVDLSGQLSFLESIALQKDAHMNYVNDSAPMHFASAVDAPVTAIYCSTLPSFGFGPLSSRSYIVEIKESLSCRPCGLHGHKSCKEGHFKCAMDIAIAQLLATL